MYRRLLVRVVLMSMTIAGLAGTFDFAARAVAPGSVKLASLQSSWKSAKGKSHIMHPLRPSQRSAPAAASLTNGTGPAGVSRGAGADPTQGLCRLLGSRLGAGLYG